MDTRRAGCKPVTVQMPSSHSSPVELSCKLRQLARLTQLPCTLLCCWVPVALLCVAWIYHRQPMPAQAVLCWVSQHRFALSSCSSCTERRCFLPKCPGVKGPKCWL